MSGKRKSFKAVEPLLVSPAMPLQNSEDPWLVRFPHNATGSRSFNFEPWTGKGIDGVVAASVSAVKALLQAGHPRASTIVGYCNRGMNLFLDFLLEQLTPVDLNRINRHCLESYIEWLQRKSNQSYSSQKKVYCSTKAVLAFFRTRGLITDSNLFPTNPYPGSQNHISPETALSANEQAALAQAVKADLIAIHNKSFQGSDSQVMTVLMVVIAMRTGLNTEPLISLNRDCMRPHPLRPNMRTLRAFKWRGRSTQIKALRGSTDTAVNKSLHAGGPVIIEMALGMTSHLVDEVAAEFKNRLWLYRSARPSDGQRPIPMTADSFSAGLRHLVARHDLRDEATGKMLIVNTSRLRKTVESSYWKITGRNLFQVAQVMQQTPEVADQSYLHATAEMERNHVFLGQALVQKWRAGDANDEKAIAFTPYSAPQNMTPVARCADPVTGDRAPKNGSACMDFLSCFSCRSFVVAEDERDLHRLFSFYWFLLEITESSPDVELTQRYQAVLILIDEVTAERFDVSLVSAARAAAKVDRHPFWRNPILESMYRDQ